MKTVEYLERLLCKSLHITRHNTSKMFSAWTKWTSYQLHFRGVSGCNRVCGRDIYKIPSHVLLDMRRRRRKERHVPKDCVSFFLPLLSPQVEGEKEREDQGLLGGEERKSNNSRKRVRAYARKRQSCVVRNCCVQGVKYAHSPPSECVPFWGCTRLKRSAIRVKKLSYLLAPLSFIIPGPHSVMAFSSWIKFFAVYSTFLNCPEF